MASELETLKAEVEKWKKRCLQLAKERDGFTVLLRQFGQCPSCGQTHDVGHADWCDGDV